MYHIFHKSKYSDGAVLNLITGSRDFGTLYFSKVEAEKFTTQENEKAISRNLTIRYFKLKAVSKAAA